MKNAWENNVDKDLINYGDRIIERIRSLFHSQAQQALDEAIAIFEKLPEDEPLTKNPVILELKVLKEKWRKL